MRIEYSEDIDFAYIHLTDDEDVRVAVTQPCDTGSNGYLLALDFDAKGRLLGIEIGGASLHLMPDLLALGEPS